MKPIGRLHVLTDTDLQTRFSHVELARMAARGGADVVQYRQKQGSTRDMIETAKQMKAACAENGALLIVNDRIDVAIAAEADGVHLGQGDFPIPLARELLGPEKIIGGSAATMDEARMCLRDVVDYIGFGPVFPTGSKADAGPVSGLAVLKQTVEAMPAPIIGIGGIDELNAWDVMNAGAFGVAVISSVCLRDDPEEATRVLRRVIDRGAKGER